MAEEHALGCKGDAFVTRSFIYRRRWADEEDVCDFEVVQQSRLREQRIAMGVACCFFLLSVYCLEPGWRSRAPRILSKTAAALGPNDAMKQIHGDRSRHGKDAGALTASRGSNGEPQTSPRFRTRPHPHRQFARTWERRIPVLPDHSQ